MRIAILRKRSNAAKSPPPRSTCTTTQSQNDGDDAIEESLPPELDAELERQNDEIDERIRNGGDHINLFADLDNVAKPNAEYVREKKDEQEKYEKQIGYLTYLGQDTNEALGKRDWYDQPPAKHDAYDAREDKKGVEVGLKNKFHHDPLNVMKKYLGVSAGKSAKAMIKKTVDLVSVVDLAHIQSARKERSPSNERRLPKATKKHRSKDKKHKSHKSHKSKKDKRRHKDEQSKYALNADEASVKHAKLAKLRAERLDRERKEQERAKALLDQIEEKATPQKAKDTTKSSSSSASSVMMPTAPVQCKQKYNSQFNPYLAKQNYD